MTRAQLLASRYADRVIPMGLSNNQLAHPCVVDAYLAGYRQGMIDQRKLWPMSPLRQKTRREQAK